MHTVERPTVSIPAAAAPLNRDINLGACGGPRSVGLHGRTGAHDGPTLARWHGQDPRLWLLPLMLILATPARVAVLAQSEDGIVSSLVVGRVIKHQVVGGETLRQLGARYGVDSSTITADSGRKAAAPLTEGEVLRIDTRHIVPPALADVPLVINVPQRMLFSRRAGTLPSAYRIAVGLGIGPHRSVRSP